MGIYNDILLKGDTAQDITGLSGLGMPRPTILHQRINARICAVMNVDLNPQYEAIVEAEIGGTNSKSPDIVVWSLDSNGEPVVPVLIIETTTNNKKTKIEDKMFGLFSNYPTLKEAFMYVYDIGVWRRYTPGQSRFYVETSESEYLKGIFNISFDFARPLKNAVFSVPRSHARAHIQSL